MTISKEARAGNPAHLAGVQWCVEQRCKIYGLYEAAKLNLDWRKAIKDQGYDADEAFEQLVIAFVNAMK